MKHLPILLLVLSIAGCQPSPAPPHNTPNTMKQPAPMRDYIGLTESEALARAKKAGVPARVVSKDGVPFAVTADYIANRLNFTVVNGRVTAMKKG